MSQIGNNALGKKGILRQILKANTQTSPIIWEDMHFLMHHQKKKPYRDNFFCCIFDRIAKQFRLVDWWCLSVKIFVNLVNLCVKDFLN